MNVEELLDMLEETLEEGTAVPFAAAKRVVDVDRCRKAKGLTRPGGSGQLPRNRPRAG